MKANNAHQRWTQLDGERQTFLRRLEIYSALTSPRICTPDEYDQNNDQLQHDWQSIGAQAVNHLVNKLMLALFAPSRPFFRLEASEKAMAEFDAGGIDKTTLGEILSLAERSSVRVMDKKSIRTKLYEVLMNLVVTGNVLFVLEKDKIRVIGIKKYVVKRDGYGLVQEMIIRDCLKIDQLEPVLQALPHLAGKDPDDKVELFKWIKRNKNGDFELTQWCDEYQLPEKFNGKWPENKMPYRVLTWVLSDGSDYGTGHVEDNVGDLQALSVLSKAETQGAVLASEYRWLVNPAGITSPEDMEGSENGAAIPGQQGDITLVSTGTTSALPHIQAIIASRERRIASSFLLGSAVTRQAERVTAEEIRMQANELETSLGGAYSRIAVDLQMPLAHFLLKEINVKIDGKDIEPVIVTGLDALSRNGDRDNTMMWLTDMAGIQNIPPSLMQILNMKAIAAVLAASSGVSTKDLILSDEVIEANIQAQQQAQVAGAEGAAPGVAAPAPPAPPQPPQ